MSRHRHALRRGDSRIAPARQQQEQCNESDRNDHAVGRHPGVPGSPPCGLPRFLGRCRACRCWGEACLAPFGCHRRIVMPWRSPLRPIHGTRRWRPYGSAGACSNRIHAVSWMGDSAPGFRAIHESPLRRHDAHRSFTHSPVWSSIQTTIKPHPHPHRRGDSRIAQHERPGRQGWFGPRTKKGHPCGWPRRCLDFRHLRG